MRVRCPACEAGYEIDETLVGPAGRSLRCAACGTVWRASPPAPPAAELEAPLPVPAALPDAFAFAAAEPAVLEAEPPPAPDALPADAPPLPAIPEPPRTAPIAAAPPGAGPAPPPSIAAQPPGITGVWVGWVATLVVLGAAGWASVEYRAEIMAAWPPSAWIYGALGLGGPG